MFLIYFHKYVLQGTSGLEGEFKSGSEEASPGCVRVKVVLVMEDVALVSLIPTASVMFIREEGLASLQLGQMGGWTWTRATPTCLTSTGLATQATFSTLRSS